MPAYNTFEAFDLSQPINKAINDLDYTKPTPIQEAAIPYFLGGCDILGQAATGTGKTAAFSLPLLSLIDSHQNKAQAIIVVPTRELALQVCKAIKDFAKYLNNLKVTAIYGGDDYRSQIKDLKAGAQIIVGTPGRLMDHMRRQTINFDSITHVVLDEADEMLKMGFIDDIKWILEQLPNRQHTALFSATMPMPIRKIALQYLKNPQEITIKSDDKKAANIKQEFIITRNKNKFSTLTRLLEASESKSVIIFARTKSMTEDITAMLLKSNFSAVALNGDMPQALRKKTVEKIKEGQVNILVATDVAARGLDIDSITHVINYDAPHDIETYTHRIGRTGRAGRSGNAILFLNPSETRMLRDIEYKTKKKITELELPSNKELNIIKLNKYKEKLKAVIDQNQPYLDNQEINFDADSSTYDLEKHNSKNYQKAIKLFTDMLQEFSEEHKLSAEEIATAIIMLSHQENPIILESSYSNKNDRSHRDRDNDNRDSRKSNSRRGDRDRSRGSRDRDGRDRDRDRNRDRGKKQRNINTRGHSSSGKRKSRKES